MEKRDQHRKPNGDEGDPIVKTFRDAPAFNRLWLKNDRRLTSTQNIGFMLVSLFMLIGGTMFLSGGLESLKDGDSFGLVLFVLATPALLLGGWLVESRQRYL